MKYLILTAGIAFLSLMGGRQVAAVPANTLPQAETSAAIEKSLPELTGPHIKKDIFNAAKAPKPKPKATETPDPRAASPPQTTDDNPQELAKQLSNPIASLISVPFQFNYDRGMGPNRDGGRATLNIQPVIPFSLNKNWNLISRTILPIINQQGITGPGQSQTGLGDIVQSIFFSPKKHSLFVWGAGPVVLVPTATDSRLGSRQLGLGATIVVLKQQSGWTYGALYNHIWRVAGGSNRPKVNSDFIQPFIAYGTKSAWTFSVNTESTYDWTGRTWSVPIHLSVSKLVRISKQPISLQGGLRCWATSPDGGPKGCGPRLTLVLLFPVKH